MKKIKSEQVFKLYLDRGTDTKQVQSFKVIKLGNALGMLGGKGKRLGKGKMIFYHTSVLENYLFSSSIL